MRGSRLGSTVHRHHEEVDRHSKMVLMLQPVAVVGAAGGLVAGASSSLGWQAALKPLTREAMLRTDCFPRGVVPSLFFLVAGPELPSFVVEVVGHRPPCG